ncbi:hypothetical protein Ahy_A07g032609 [Arachis hypogaea]|uniref:Uncharacterized protein n=1 Tax=Arachis hypogaea TaxID=3818 RepID=A0A445C782_ARAHY|nr:hypothetical protein Ahy_A07g032609 [Arachis hypogaea]
MLPSSRRTVPPSLPHRAAAPSLAPSFAVSRLLPWLPFQTEPRTRLDAGTWGLALVIAFQTEPRSGKTTLLLALTGRLDHSLKNLLKLDALSGRMVLTLSRVAVTRTSSEKYSDFSLPTSQYSKEQSKSCEICRRFETSRDSNILYALCVRKRAKA